MISYLDSMIKGDGVLSLCGLSTDQKPTDTYDGQDVGNGSSFFEIDTQTVKFYDKSSETWK